MAEQRDDDHDRTADALADMAGAEKRPRPARPDRPEAPNMPGWQPVHRGDAHSAAELLGEVTEDDDDIGITLPPPDALAHPPAAAPAPTGRQAPTLSFQRTLIPVLLTCGVLLIFTGAMRWVAGDDSPFGTFSGPLSLIMLVGGALVLFVGVLNVLYVRAMLAARPQPPEPGAARLTAAPGERVR